MNINEEKVYPTKVKGKLKSDIINKSQKQRVNEKKLTALLQEEVYVMLYSWYQELHIATRPQGYHVCKALVYYKSANADHEERSSYMLYYEGMTELEFLDHIFEPGYLIL